MKLFYNIKKNLYCKFFHKKDICYPRVDLPSPECEKHWHCAKCHPCNEGLMEILENVDEYANKMQWKTIDKVD